MFAKIFLDQNLKKHLKNLSMTNIFFLVFHYFIFQITRALKLFLDFTKQFNTVVNGLHVYLT